MSADGAADPSGQHAFHRELAEQTPSLRAFARSLTRHADRADDLAQETLLKAWANRDRYQPGTKLRAWLFTIMRNTYYSDMRKRGREVEDVDGALTDRMAEKPSQDAVMAMRDFQTALATLPDDQRDALILVGAAGLSYEEAAAVCGCAIGTVKSRVNRARNRLATMLGAADGAEMTADARMDAAMGGAITCSAA